MRPVPLPICMPLLHTFEGSGGQHEAVPTRDPGGHWEIGWSHLIANQDNPLAEFPDPLTREQADALAGTDLDIAAASVCRIIGDEVAAELTDAQYAALIDFTYNEGADKFATSTLARLVAAGNFVRARGEFPKWIYGHSQEGTLVEEPGLIRRRRAESNLWLA